MVGIRTGGISRRVEDSIAVVVDSIGAGGRQGAFVGIGPGTVLVRIIDETVAIVIESVRAGMTLKAQSIFGTKSGGWIDDAVPIVVQTVAARRVLTVFRIVSGTDAATVFQVDEPVLVVIDTITTL